MACEVCEHCHEPLTRGSILRGGCSYHEKCHKCYVCSETNLHNAEIFKGVIFCSSCSKRIFQGCSSARRSKESAKSKSSKKSKPRKRHDRSRARYPRREEKPYNSGTVDMPCIARPKPELNSYNSGIIELAHLARSFDSFQDTIKSYQTLKSKSIPITYHVGTDVYDGDTRDMKKRSTEMGTTTEVTHQLLKEIICPVIDRNNNKSDICHSLKPRRMREDLRRMNSSSPTKRKDSDLRMAELGASTEIATMTLRKQSDLPVTIKSRSPIGPLESFNLTTLSGGSLDEVEDWIDSTKTVRRTPMLDRSIRSLLNIPVKYFKNNILDRSSLISILMSTQYEEGSLLQRIKQFFSNEINLHHRRGVKRLYSTINHRKVPFKLGWLHIHGLPKKSKQKKNDCKLTVTCRHYRDSHSYRCLRAHVMKHAGPTKSELARFRTKVVNATQIPQFFRWLFPYTTKDMLSASCGNSEAVPVPVKKKSNVAIRIKNSV